MKVLTEETCPGCKKTFESSHEMENIEPVINKGTIKEINSSNQTTILEEKPPQEVENPKPEKIIEDFKPRYECPNGDCDLGGIHKNKHYKKKPKGKCTNCDQFTRHSSGTCPWCKSTEIEELDPEALEDLGIKAPEIEEHNHE